MLRHEDGRPFTYQEYGEFMPWPQVEVIGFPGFIPEQTTEGLVDLSESLGVRKTTFTFPDPLPEDYPLPEPITEAVRIVNRWDAVNTAILKRYSLGEPSNAYFPHEDPKIFRKHRLALISASGEAIASIHLPDGSIEQIPCSAGTFLHLAPHIVHSITPPLNEDGVRDLLFLGYDSSLVNIQSF